ncbi:MatE domain-containing protein [Cephalotus follicularis]|uniref:Protein DETOXIFICATION n=1 Tax=Cephalotus follicularis TaxID=3775 RepID=A0A1Q3CAC7_CEPFO|nr:MatE domain-containing protein [Cephalotus follicularis]
MYTDSDIESRGIINGDAMVTKDGGEYNEETMRARSEGTFIHGCLRPVTVNGILRKLPFNEVGEEVVALGKIVCPIVMTTLLLNSRPIVSMLFLGHIGKAELAGGSLAIGFANITGTSVLKGLSMGMDPICGQAYGAKRWSVLSQTYQKMLFLLLSVSIPISLLWLNTESIFLRLGQDPEITKVAKVYMAFSVPELLAQAILNPTRTFLRTQGLTTPLTIAAICAVILHPPINYIFAVYFNLGVKGVALALACNTLNMIMGLVIYMVLSKRPLKPWHGVKSFTLFHGWQPVLSLALPSVVSVCLEWWWYEIMLFLCGLLRNPKDSVAAMGILIQTTSLIYVFPFALNNGLATRVGQALGSGQPSRAQWTTIIGLTIAFAYGLSSFVFMTVQRSEWGKLFTYQPEILELISAVLPILGLCEVGNSPQTAGCGVLVGTARPKDGARINLCSFYLIGMPVAVLTTFKFKVGFRGLWFGLLAAQISCVIMMVYTLTKTDWKHQAKRADELTKAVGQRDEMETGLLSTKEENIC